MHKKIYGQMKSKSGIGGRNTTNTKSDTLEDNRENGEQQKYCHSNEKWKMTGLLKKSSKIEKHKLQRQNYNRNDQIYGQKRDIISFGDDESSMERRKQELGIGTYIANIQEDRYEKLQ